MSNNLPPQPYEPERRPVTSEPTADQPEVSSPPATNQRKGPGVGTAIAVAAVTALLIGAGAGYAGGTFASNNSQAEAYNALQAESVSSDSPAPEGSVEEVASAVLPAVVSLEVAGRTGVAEGSGSIISSDGYVLTNHHVISAGENGAAEIVVTLNDGSRHSATFVASDVDTDIGVVKIDDAANLPVINFGDSDDLQVGQDVVAVGSPLGLSATVTSGIVSALNRPVRAAQGFTESSLMDGIQTDAAINPGNSGGPLVDMNGNLVGMNSVIASLSTGMGGESGSIGLGFAIPSNFAKRVAQQLIETGEATQPMLGVQVDIRNTGGGAFVAGVEPGSPADEAGLEVGDVITRLGDRPIDTADALIAATRSRDFGETVELEVRRQGTDEVETVEVTLSSE
ncbi:S1C family serine protease [Corynebacterium auris]|uniref:S1C family serine protease n=1 Tax=Corynebacterium auris TaxID=44750 RepID=UPI0025B58010|nr:trypsin-like peptidase domain-containing protein [Corynebacterium auris]WJY67623.1 Periplasmic pH-dependent serine endoprotease DegQ precursor [Corynebacterium auris]